MSHKAEAIIDLVVPNVILNLNGEPDIVDIDRKLVVENIDYLLSIQED